MPGTVAGELLPPRPCGRDNHNHLHACRRLYRPDSRPDRRSPRAGRRGRFSRDREAGRLGTAPARRLTAVRRGHAAEGQIPRAGRRQRRRRNHASTAAGARWGRPRQAPPRSHARPLRSGPCRAGCRELGAGGTPAYRGLTQIIPLTHRPGMFASPPRGSLKPLPARALAPGGRKRQARAGACACGARSGDVRARPARPRIRVDLEAASAPGRRHGCGRGDDRDARPGSAGGPPCRVSPQARWPAAECPRPRGPAHGQAKPHSATAVSRSASRRRESMGRHWVNVHMLLTWMNRESWMFWIRLQMAPGTHQEVLLHR